MANQISGYSVFLNVMYAAYAEQYRTFQSRYRVIKAPFSCSFDGERNSNRGYHKVLSYARNLKINADPCTSDVAKRQATFARYQAASQETGNHHTQFPGVAFEYARLSQHPLGNRLADFYGGKFTDYYCKQGSLQKIPGAKAATLWPTSKHYANPKFRSALDGFSFPGIPFRAWDRFFSVLVELDAQDRE